MIFNRVFLEVQEDKFVNLILFEIIGILTAILHGTISADVGIWTLASSGFCDELEKSGLIDKQLVKILSICDELPAIKEVAGNDYFNELIIQILPVQNHH